MVRTGVNVSFDEECYEIIKKMPDNTLSEVCRNAVKEWAGHDVSVETAETKVKALKNGIEQDKVKLDFWKKKTKELKKAGAEKLAMEKKTAEQEAETEAEKEKKKKEEELELHIKSAKGKFEITDDKATKIAKEYQAHKERALKGKEKLKGFAPFVREKGIKEKKPSLTTHTQH